MAKDINTLRQEAQQVQNATQVGENTAQRVGGVLTDLVDKAEEHETDIDNLNANTGIDDYPVFSTTEDYKSGDVVNYQGKLYQFTADHAAGAWTGSGVSEISLNSDLRRFIGKGYVNTSKGYKNVVLPWVPGYITQSGVLHIYNDYENDNYMYTEAIRLDGVKRISIRKGYANPYISPIAFYNSPNAFSENLISAPLNVDSGFQTNLNVDVEVPEGATYVRFTSQQSNITEIYFDYALSLGVAINMTNILKNSEDINNQGMEISSLLINSQIELYKDGDFTSLITEDGWINSDKEVHNDHNWAHGRIPINNSYNYIVLNKWDSTYNRVVYYYFEDADGTTISSFSMNEMPKKVEIPSGATQLLVSVRKTYLSQLFIFYAVGEIEQRIEDNERDISNINYLDKIDDAYGYLTESGWIMYDGTIHEDGRWVHGTIPINENRGKYLQISNWTNAIYSVVYGFFKNSDDETIGSGILLNKLALLLEIPEGATGFFTSAFAAYKNDFLVAYTTELNPIFLSERIAKNEEDISNLTQEDAVFSCPDKLYAVVGEEFNLYYDNVIQALDAGLQSPFGMYVDVQCPDLQNASNQIGVRRERMWQIMGTKLTDDYIGEHNMLITVYRSDRQVLAQKTVKLVVSSNDPLSTQKYVLCIGDSLTNNGPIVQTCGKHFEDIGGTQPVFIGQRTTSGYKHEGYPGYTFGSFVSQGSLNYKIFDVPSETSVTLGDRYETNGSQYVIRDIRTEGLDNALRLRCERTSGSTEPNSTGTLTKVSGASSSPESITYSAYESESGDPFWDVETGANNFTKYRQKLGMGCNKFDVVIIMLGTNDAIVGSQYNSTNNAKTLINSIFSDAGDYPTKVILQIPPLDANTISSWQVYSDMSNNSRKMFFSNNMWNLRKSLYDEFTKDEWKNKVIIGQAPLGLDRYYGFPYSEVQSSTRISSINEAYHTNSVHPNVQGYQQLGDGYYLQLKAIL